MDQQDETIKRELKQLTQEARLLADKVIAGESLDAAAQQKAQTLEAQLAQLTKRISVTPKDVRPGLEWQRDKAERYLLAVFDSFKETELSVEQQIAKVSQRAFQLATGAAASDFASYQAEMKSINEQLDILQPSLATVPESSRAETITAWTDARLEVGFVLSSGEMPMSMRLFYHLEAQKRAS
jgi:hypothetical protein